MLKFINNHFKFSVLILVFAVVIPAINCIADDMYLDPTNDNSERDGRTVDTAFNTTEELIDNTSPDDIIHILNMDFYINNPTGFDEEKLFERTLDNQDWPDRIYVTDKVSQFGITWTFDKEYRIGQFVNHEMWVIGPVSIIDIFPASVQIENAVDAYGEVYPSWIKNGSQIDPDPTIRGTGYDSSLRYGGFDSSLNVALGIAELNPLIIDSDASLISSISRNLPNMRPQIKGHSILTVLLNVPGFGSFRPAYCGNDKTIKFNFSDIDFSKLSNIVPVGDFPRIAEAYDDLNEAGETNPELTRQPWSSAERACKRPWVDHNPRWTGGYIRAINNCKSYGREYAVEVGQIALLLNCNYTNDEKKKLLVSFLQVGIDNYGVISNGGLINWGDEGGWTQGRKFPILFAGTILDDQDMMDIGKKSGAYLYADGYGPDNPPPDYIRFNEDCQTFYVKEDDIYSIPYQKETFKGWTWYGHGYVIKEYEYTEYTEHHLGMPEWGLEHATESILDGMNWDTDYRVGSTATSYTGFILAAHIMGIKSLWNHNALFDYQDRFLKISGPDGLYPGLQSWDPWAQQMWDAIRDNYPPVWDEDYDFVAPKSPDRLLVSVVTNDTITLSWKAPEKAVDGDGASSYRVIRDDQMIANNYLGTSYVDSGLSSETIYEYRVYSLDDVGIESKQPGLLSVLTLPVNNDNSKPSSVTKLQFDLIEANRIELSWQSSVDSESGIYHYIIYRNSEIIDTCLTNSYIDTLIEPAKDYVYQVLAVNNAGLVSDFSSSIQCTSLIENLVLNITFTNDQAIDVSTYNHNVTSEGVSVFSNGVSGPALDTSNDKYICVSDDEIFNTASELSISIWGKRSSTSGYDHLIYKKTGFLLNLTSSGYLQTVAGNFDLGTYNNTSWHHYCLTFKNGLYKIYIDSNLIYETSSGDSTIGESGDDIYIGKKPGKVSFNGVIDEVRIYRRELEQNEIQEIYQNGSFPVPVSDYTEPTFEFYSSNYSNALSVAPAETSASYAFHSTEPGPGLILYSTSEILVNDFADELEAELFSRRENGQQLFDNDQLDVSLLDTILSAPKYNGVTYELTDRDTVGTGHTATLSSLSDNKEYFYGIACSDQYGNVGVLDYDSSKGSTKLKFTTLAIVNPNTDPVANGDSLSVSEDITKVSGDLTSNDTDADGDPLTVVAASQGSHGSVINNGNGTVTYIPVANYYGADSFSYTISDGNGGTDSALVTVNVASVNDVPTGTDDTMSVSEDVAKVSGDLTANDTDIEGDMLSITLVSPANHGTATSNGDGTVTYEPAANYHGTDSFTYTISDGNGGSATATVNVTVASVNDTPVAVNDSISVNEDIAKIIGNLLSNDADADGDSLSISEVTQGSNGTVVNNGDGTVTYTPSDNFNGIDGFSYTVSDGKGGTNTALVRILVSAVNDKPVAVSDSISTNEDSAKTSGNLLTNDTDVEGDTLTVSAVTQGTNGTVVNNGNGTVTYTPSANFNGTDAFTYIISDGNGGTSSGTVNVNVSAEPDTPVITASSTKSVQAQASLAFAISASDADGDGITFGFTGVPTGASFADNGNGTASFSWTPDKDQAGSYTIVVTATDDSATPMSSAKSIQISVSDAGNNLPVLAQVADQTVTEMSNLSFAISATDSDGDTLTYWCISKPSGASFNASSKTFSWTPDYDAADSSPYTAEFKVDDGFNGTDSIEVTINVDNLNRDPLFGTISAPGFKENSAGSFTLSATDEDGDALTYSSSNLPDGASLNPTSGLFSWTPGYDDSGIKPVNFTVADTNGGSANKTVTLGVENINREPEFTSSSAYSVIAANRLQFTVYTSDPDNDDVTVTCDSKPGGAAFDSGNNRFAWVPDEGTQGSYTAKFTATDSNGGTASQTVSIAVGLGNQAPVFTPVAVAAANETDTVTFTAKATDPDGDNLTYSLAASPSGATINSSGVVTWQTGYDDAGMKSFVVTATDGSLSTNLSVSVTVKDLNRDPSIIVSGDLSPIYTDGLQLTVKTSDGDGDLVSVSVNNLPEGAKYSSSTGTITWLPERNNLGDYEITVLASDGVSEISETVEFSIIDDPGYVPNQSPIFVEVAKQQVDEGDTVVFAVQATDPENDTVTIESAGVPSGSVFLNNTFTWQTGTKDIGNHSVTFIASDGHASVSMTVLIEVKNVNAAPIAAVTGTTKLAAGQALSLTIKASDEDGDTLTYSLKGAPNGMIIDGNMITWKSSSSDEGVYTISVIVSDGQLSVNVPVSIMVASAATDKEPPFIVSTYPDNESIQIPLNPLITFTIADYGEGVDYESVSISIDGVTVFTGGSMASSSEDGKQAMYSSEETNIVRTGNPSRYTFQYQAVDLFDYDYTPEIVINAKDISGNRMEPFSFGFTTEMFSMAKAIPVETTKSSPTSSAQSEPAIAVCSSGVVWSAWNEGSVGSRSIKFAPYYDNIGQFDASRTIPGIGDMSEPDAVAADNGDLYFVWQNNISGNWDIYIGRSSNGISMDMTATVSTSEEDQTDPVVSISQTGDIYVAYVSHRKTGKDVYVAKLSSDLSSVSESSVCSDNAEQVNPAIASGMDGDVHVVWEDFRDGDTSSVYAASLNGGWRNYKLSANSSDPDIAVDTSSDYLHTTWTSFEDIYYCKVPLPLDGKSIIPVNVVDDSSGAVQSGPSVYHFNNGTVDRTIIAWTDARNAYTNNDYDIYFASVDRGSMTNILATIDSELNYQATPAIATNISGAPYIVFQEQGAEGDTIHMACASVVERTLSRNRISASEGGYVGVRIEDIDSIDDVSIIVPAGALSSDIDMSIARVSNPPSDSQGIRSLFSYDFGPSSTREFRKAVNIVIPYPAILGDSKVTVYWYNPQTGSYSQSGMSNIATLDINSELKAISFETTHFSQYSVSSEPGEDDPSYISWMVSGGAAVAR